MKVEVSSLDKRLIRFEKPLRKTAEGFFKFYKSKFSTRVEIVLVNSSQMRKINFRYRGKDEATDVVAVEAPDFPSDSIDLNLGEIYLSPAALKDKPHDIHYALIHGLLHLLGFTHEGKSDKIEMEKIEKEVLIWLDHKS
ncbi:MAG: rRNA maturation RNase YbeY [Candidatus Colwellbacteria bacterium]